MVISNPKFSAIAAEDRLQRKRQAARLRQQRCRARKRAMAAAAIAAAKHPSEKLMVDDHLIKPKRKAQQLPTNMKMSEMPKFYNKPTTHVPNNDNRQTTVDGVRMSKRAAVHAALLDEHNRKFFAQVEAEQTTDKKDESVESSERAPISHVVIKQSAPAPGPNTPPQSQSPMHSFYRHAPYPPGAYYPYPAYGARPHSKYAPPPPPPPPPPPHHPAYPMSPPPMFRGYDGHYHPIPPHALPHPRQFPSTMAPPQHSMMDSRGPSFSSTNPPPSSNTVSDDDRSTPSPELSPSSGSDEEASLQSMEQDAIAAMLTLSSASNDEEYKEVAEPPLPPVLTTQ